MSARRLGVKGAARVGVLERMESLMERPGLFPFLAPFGGLEDGNRPPFENINCEVHENKIKSSVYFA